MASGGTVIKMRGKVDYESVQPVVTRMSDALRGGRVNLVLDVSEVETLTGGALGALLLLQTDVEQCGGSIKIAAPNPSISQTLKTHGFTGVFETYANAKAALRALGGGEDAA